MPGASQNAELSRERSDETRHAISLSLLVAEVLVVIVFGTTAVAAAPTESRAQGLAAWQQVYSVLTHPRCINCHTATDHPDQGDDRHRHAFNVVRGPANQGVPGLTCQTCHQPANASTGVPGGPGWKLAPMSMRWQDLDGRILSSLQVCQSVTNRATNGHLDGAALLEHHSQAPLVRWAFAPGHLPSGAPLTLPPLTHDAFVAATRTWVEAGTPCP